MILEDEDFLAMFSEKRNHEYGLLVLCMVLDQGKIFSPVIFLTIRQGWNYLLHLVEEKSSLEKPN